MSIEWERIHVSLCGQPLSHLANGWVAQGLALPAGGVRRSDRLQTLWTRCILAAEWFEKRRWKSKWWRWNRYNTFVWMLHKKIQEANVLIELWKVNVGDVHWRVIPWYSVLWRKWQSPVACYCRWPAALTGSLPQLGKTEIWRGKAWDLNG